MAVSMNDFEAKHMAVIEGKIANNTVLFAAFDDRHDAEEYARELRDINPDMTFTVRNTTYFRRRI